MGSEKYFGLHENSDYLEDNALILVNLTREFLFVLRDNSDYAEFTVLLYTATFQTQETETSDDVGDMALGGLCC